VEVGGLLVSIERWLTHVSSCHSSPLRARGPVSGDHLIAAGWRCAEAGTHQPAPQGMPRHGWSRKKKTEVAILIFVGWCGVCSAQC